MSVSEGESNEKKKELILKDCECTSGKYFWSDELLTNLKEQFSGIKQQFCGINEQFGGVNNAIKDLKLCMKNEVQKLENTFLSKITEVTKAVTEAKSASEINAAAIQEIRAEMSDLRRECNGLKTENADLKRQCNNMESYSRRENIIFHGIKDCEGESNEQCVATLREFMKNILNIDGNVVDGIKFVRCHRLRGDRRFARPIIARFREYSDREQVWGKITELPRNGNFFLSEDYPKSVVFNRKKLRPIFNRARKSIGKREVSLKNDQLIISGKQYSVANLMELEGDLHPRSFSRRTNADMLVFGGALSEYESLSNWGKYPVTFNGTTYATLEHGYMHAKCQLNGDVTSAQAVLKSPEPYMAKQFGGKVKVNKVIWTAAKSEEVMADLLKAKFADGSDLAKELLATGDK